jgi:pyruvate dehydrogenase E2 component (dihydrolipoamide acetyltransferase)
VVHVVMPQFGETVAEGELTRWLVSVGDTVVVDQPIAEISTDKVDTEVVASDAGQVTALLVDVGSTVAVGAPLLELDGSGGSAAGTATPAAPEERAPRQLVPASATSAERTRSTPKARRLAQELGVDLATLSSGRRVVRAGDVVAAVASASPAIPPPSPGQYLLQHSRIRRITAQRTRDSLSIAATAWSVTEVDYSNVDVSRKALTAAWKSRFGSSLTYLPYVLRAVSLALVQYPRLNAEYREDGLLVSEAVNIGVAVDLGDGGLSVPVLRDAAHLSVADAALELNRIAGAARSGTLGADDYSGSTFAVTNNGSYGTVLTMPVINQPNVGILSFDAVTLQPAVVTLGDGSLGIAIRPKGALALSWDHRAIDGAYAAKFLSAVKSLLETTAWDVSLPL